MNDYYPALRSLIEHNPPNRDDSVMEEIRAIVAERDALVGVLEFQNKALKNMGDLLASEHPSPSEDRRDAVYGVEDEVALTHAVSVMDDVLTDIAVWEDTALADAVRESQVDLRAIIESIRMTADPSYVPAALASSATEQGDSDVA